MYKFAAVKGINFAYQAEGTGEPVVLLHGITTNSFIWNEISKSLSKKFSVYAIDLIGCGKSDKPLEVNYSLKNQARLIFNLLEELGLERVHLAAHDVGGGIAQILAVNYPHKFYDVSLINTVAYDFWPVQPIIAMRTPIIRQFAMATLDVGALKLIVKRGLYHKEVLNNNLIEKFSGQMKSKGARKAFLHFARCLNNKDLTEISEDIKKIDIPVQIIRGEADVYLSKNISDELNENIPNSILHTIKTAGHYAMLDEPSLISNLLLSFMKKDHDS